MRDFVLYLRQRLKIILVFLIFAVIFTVSFVLYHLPVKAVLYPTLLCAGFGLVLLIYCFLQEKERLRTLSRLKEALENLSVEQLPAARGMVEEEYHGIIDNLLSERHELTSRTDVRYADMIDYYTLWAHQIKTPIAAMRLNLQNEDSQLSRKLMSDLLRIEQYVEMVLTFLRLDSEATDYVFAECELDAVIKGAVKKFRGEFIVRKIGLVYEPGGIKILTDEKWLSFVIEQVISNALKYTRQGHIEIVMEGDVLCIKDTGIGIAAEDLPRIFEKGYTGYNGRSDKKASGIGLYLCKRICAKLGHTISAESVVGEGTVIRINLTQKRLVVE